MKFIFFVVGMIVLISQSFSQLGYQTHITQATIIPGGSFQETIYAKPSSDVPSGVVYNILFAVSIPIIDPEPANPSGVSLVGGSITAAARETISGRYVYPFQISVNPSTSILSSSGNGTPIATITFPESVAGEIVQLNDFTGTGTINGYWYISYNGFDNTNYVEKFFGTGASNSEYGDSYVNSSGTLPIKLVLFHARSFIDYSTFLSWSIASTLNTSHFELYRSTDGMYWDNIARVVSTGAENYSYIDDGLKMRSSQNVFYYRLKVVDRDGSHFFSDIRNVKFLRTDERYISIYPNPAGNKSVLDLSALNPADGLIEVLIYDMSGKQLIKSWIALNQAENIDLSGMPDNTYNVLVRQGENVYSAKLIKAGN